MKKFIVFIITAIVLMLTASATAKASDYETKYQWLKAEYNGDELKGIEPYTAYMLMSKTESDIDVLIDWHIESVSIIPSKNYVHFLLKRGIFNANTALIGFYDSNGTLVKKTECSFRDKNKSGYIINEEVIDYIMNNDGKIRIVIDRYDDTDYDVYIPTFSASKIVDENEILGTK